MGSLVHDDPLPPHTAETHAVEALPGTVPPTKPKPRSTSRRKPAKSKKGGVAKVPAAPTPSTTRRGGAANLLAVASARRSFTSDFKQSVLDAYNSDPDCIGNQRATARKFKIHRRQVQKWLTQLEKEGDCSHSSSQEEQNPHQEGGSLSNCSLQGPSSVTNSPSSSPSSHDPEVKEALKDPQVDLCTMSSAAMAMSLNLTHTPTSNSVIVSNSHGGHGKPFQHQHRSRNNSSPTVPLHSSAITSPNSLLSKFYSLYAPPPPSREPSSASSAVGNLMPLKYPTLNFNGNGTSGGSHHSKGPPPPEFMQQPRHNRPRQQQHGGNNGSMPFSHHIQILDEIAAAYPHDDFSLLRQALIRNEVSFTKVPPATPKSTFFPSEACPERTWGGNGKDRDRSRTCSPNMSMSPNGPSRDHINGPSRDHNIALELQRQQTDYMRLLQQSGLNFSDLSPEALKGTSKYQWLLTQAAATLGLPLLGQQPVNGQRKHQSQSPPPHVFVSPKPPSNSKPKTVAAALAASRNSPNSLLNQFAAGAYELPGNGNRGRSVKKRSTAPRKRNKPAQQNAKPCTITRPPSHQDDEGEYLDPMSMLEVTTSSGGGGGKVGLTNGGSGYPSNGDHGTHFLHSMLHQSDDEGVLGNQRLIESPEDQEIKNYMDQHSERKSPSSGEPDGEQVTKAVALDAFTYDPEVAGDCRAVARKFGLNVRVVMKWIKESAAKTNAHQQQNAYENNYGAKPINGNGNGDMYSSGEEYYGRSQAIKMNGGGATNHEDDPRLHIQAPPSLPTSSNKRKNSKPNQICDFQQDVEDDDLGFGDVPLDMMIPIKKRRVSSQE